MNCSMPGYTVLHYLLEFAEIMSVESVILPNHLIFFPFRLRLPSIFPSIKTFPVSWLFTSGGQIIGASASATVLPMNIQVWFPLGLTGLIFLKPKWLSRVFFSTTIRKHHFLEPLYGPTLTSVNDYWKNHSFDFYDLGWKLMPLLFNMLSSFVIAFLKEQVSFNFMAAVTIHSDFRAQKNKICHGFHFFPFYLTWSDGTRCHDLSVIECWVSRQLFHSPFSCSSKGSLVPLPFLPLEGYHLHIRGYWYFYQQS